MSFEDAITTGFRKYADFQGRASRSEYWWLVLFVVIGSIALHRVSHALAALFSLGCLIPMLSAATRRLHDTNRSGWWQLICLVPVIGTIVLVVMLAQEGPAPADAGAPAPSR